MKKMNLINLRNKSCKLYNGDFTITFTIVDINFDKETINIAITNQGKISICTYQLLENSDGFYFEYGTYFEKVYLNDFIKCRTIAQNDKNYKIKDYEHKTVVYLEFTKIEKKTTDYAKLQNCLNKLKGTTI